MKNFRKQDGFTLVELMVTILNGTIITAAAVTVLLLGLRVNFKSNETVSRQNTTRILLSALESMATEGSIEELKTDLQSWSIKSNGNVAFSYSAEKQTIYTGSPENGTPLLEGVYASFVTLDNKQLTVTVETEDGSYASSIYCRIMDDIATNKPDTEIDGVIEETQKPNTEQETEKTGREKFLYVLASQYTGTGFAANKGWIIDDSADGVMYYAQWYNPDWPMKTPWCACFVSWGIDQIKGNLNGTTPRYANVDTFMADFQNGTAGSWKESAYKDVGVENPAPGDIVFFDWIVNGQDNPQHAGVVLSVEGDTIYTIEGNTAGMVAIRKYSLKDPCILGYGVLNWK